jgi:hypothetical protein
MGLALRRSSADFPGTATMAQIERFLSEITDQRQDDAALPRKASGAATMAGAPWHRDCFLFCHLR